MPENDNVLDFGDVLGVTTLRDKLHIDLMQPFKAKALSANGGTENSATLPQRDIVLIVES